MRAAGFDSRALTRVAHRIPFSVAAFEGISIIMAPDKKRIAVLTSGGDAPGMNAAVRAVVRSSLRREWEIVGIRFGFAGLLSRDFCNLETRDVSGTIDKGGTFL